MTILAVELFCFVSVFRCFGVRVTLPLCVAQAGLGLSILLPQPPKCWDYSTYQARSSYFNLDLVPAQGPTLPCLGAEFLASFYLPSTLQKEPFFNAHFFKGGDRGSEKLSNLPEITQQSRAAAET
jgi:hypothetical protein